MIRQFLLLIFLLPIPIFSIESQGQISSKPMSPLPSPKAPTEQPHTEAYKPPPKPTPQGVSASAVYTSPGIATLQGGRWVGSEHLYNVSPNLGVIVESIQSGSKTDLVNEQELKDRALAILRAGGLTPQANVIANPTPLPFLHILILLMPIEGKGYSVFCSGRLLEQMELRRIHLSESIVWQGITWEKQELLILPTADLQSQLDKCVDTIVNAFVARIKAYPTQAK